MAPPEFLRKSAVVDLVCAFVVTVGRLRTLWLLEASGAPCYCNGGNSVTTNGICLFCQNIIKKNNLVKSPFTLDLSTEASFLKKNLSTQTCRVDRF